jgi:hypothetical protein
LTWLPAALPTAASLLAAAACGAANDAVPLRGNFTLEEARAFTGFPIYYAGERVDDFPLVAVLRRDDTADYVSFVYGDCLLTVGDHGCAPPAEIQVWRGCRRGAELYDRSAPASPAPPERTTIRGAPAALIDDGTRVELFTRGATIVVFAGSRTRARRLAEALRPVRASQPSSEPLPPPAESGEGSVGC